MNKFIDKRIFILGDSHGCTEYNGTNGFYSWTWFIDEHFENLEVYNYSVPGGNNFLTDLTLRKLLIDESPTTVILNISGLRRFIVPVAQTDLKWNVKKIKDKYINYEINTDSFFKTHFSKVRCSNSHYYYRYKDLLYSLVSKNMSDNNIIITYNRLFVNTLNLYKDHIENFLYWQFDNEIEYVKNNIEMDFTVIEFLERKYGIRKVLKKYLDSSLHLNKEGARVVFEEYILPSKIGKILREINDR